MARASLALWRRVLLRTAHPHQAFTRNGSRRNTRALPEPYNRFTIRLRPDLRRHMLRRQTSPVFGNLSVTRTSTRRSRKAQCEVDMTSAEVDTSSTFQSTSTPCALNTMAAAFAMRSYPSVARARMVGPAPERQIPSSPGCEAGVTDASTSGRPGIYNITERRSLTASERLYAPRPCDMAGGCGPSWPRR